MIVEFGIDVIPFVVLFVLIFSFSTISLFSSSGFSGTSGVGLSGVSFPLSSFTGTKYNLYTGSSSDVDLAAYPSTPFDFLTKSQYVPATFSVAFSITVTTSFRYIFSLIYVPFGLSLNLKLGFALHFTKLLSISGVSLLSVFGLSHAVFGMFLYTGIINV